MGLFAGGKKRAWLIVRHYWFVHCRGWDHELLPEATKKEAQAYAALKQQQGDKEFQHCSCQAIELPDTVVVINQGAEKCQS